MTPSPIDSEFVIVDLPVRLTAADIDRVNAAVAHTAVAQTSGMTSAPHAEPRNVRDVARDLVALRRERELTFGADLFSDPGWDLLLDLFVAEGTHRPLTVSGTCHGAASPPTTVLRHLRTLEQRGLVVRAASNGDRRVAHVRLSDAAAAAMASLLSAGR